MVAGKLCLIQKAGSAHSEMLDQALSLARHIYLVNELDQALPTDAEEGDTLLVWDLWGFGQDQIRRWSRVIKQAGLNMVLVLDRMDQASIRLLDMPGVIAFIPPVATPSLAAAQMRLAMGLHAELNRLQARKCELEEQLDQRDVIERAKSVLMTALGISESEAMRRMQRQARNNNQKLVEVAQGILRAQGTW